MTRRVSPDEFPADETLTTAAGNSICEEWIRKIHASASVDSVDAAEQVLQFVDFGAVNPLTFDHPYYIILNLAIGQWAKNPRRDISPIILQALSELDQIVSAS